MRAPEKKKEGGPIYIHEKSDKKCCVYRVPESIRKVNREAYTPQLISIGPLHHGKKKLATWEKKKETYMQSFLKRRNNMEAIKKEFSNFIMSNEWDIRECYSENSKLKSKEFVKMILDDAIFIIELFVRNCDDHERERERDLLLDVPVVKWTLSLDLRLLENQLPYFVLEKICELAIASPTLTELSYHFFLDNSLFDRYFSPDQGVKIKHFTDLGRSVLLKRFKKVESYELKNASLPSVVKLDESGVKFKSVDRDCLLDIRFEKRICSWLKGDELQIPNLKIFDETECLLRNMMALEQCHYPEDNRVCAYVSLLGSLINTEKDVDLLVNEEIITSFMDNNDSVAKMFNRLCLHHRIDMFIYSDIIDELNAHYQKTWNHAKATLKSVYFSDLWKGTGTVVAAILVVFQLIQVILSFRRSS